MPSTVIDAALLEALQEEQAGLARVGHRIITQLEELSSRGDLTSAELIALWKLAHKRGEQLDAQLHPPAPTKACKHPRKRAVGTSREGMGNIVVDWCPDCGALKRTMTNWEYKDYPWERPARSGGRKLPLAAAVGLIDGAYDIVELWRADSPSQKQWREDWLKKARELGATPG